MHCPYCISDIPDQALACPNCARDLYLFRPLLQGLAALEATVAEQNKKITALEGRLTALEKTGMSSSAVPTEALHGNEPGSAQIEVRAAAAAVPRHPLPPANPLGALLPCVIVPILLLLLAHWLMLFIYDVKPLYLRMATLVLPIPFGAILASRYGLPVGLAAGFSAILGGLAVTGMLGVTAIADKVAFLPQNVRDWRETIEYTAGIGLACVTGWLIANGIRAATSLRHREPPRVIVLVAKAFKTNEKGEMAVELLARRIQKLVNTATPAVSGAVAFYAGLKGVMGDG